MSPQACAARSPALKTPILRAANAIWLKSPFRQQPTPEEFFAIQVRLVRSFDELLQCAALRFRVYDALGYLDESLSASRAKLELDYYDFHSLHLCAVDHRSGEVAGILRIVLPVYRYRGATNTPECDEFVVARTADRSQLRRCVNRRKYRVASITDAIQIQRGWVHRIVTSGKKLQEKYHQADPLIHFPIMDNSNFGDCWPHFLNEYDPHHTAEISRVIVSPRYRGMGISTLLIRAAIALSVHMELRHLVLECIPLHVEMYQKHGFEALPKYHCRSRDLDQIAVGMRLCLQEAAANSTAIAMARRELKVLCQGAAADETILGGRGLCLCRLRECWTNARYPHLGRKDICPLVRDGGD